jgi:hypothetical protein
VFSSSGYGRREAAWGVDDGDGFKYVLSVPRGKWKGGNFLISKPLATGETS